MAADAGLVEFARDLFAGLEPITARRMFGGTGLFVGDAMFAVIFRDRIYMKAGGELSAAYRAAGSEPFAYEAEGARRELGLMSLPEAALDDPEEAMAWARRSLAVAEQAAEKRVRRRR
ncbi:MAG TPA: TfoX/Sxy family protein [Paracoccaceae bacterium]|nr:TfoX/Sxy family protein [Paracoccaceae bacterium]